MPNRIIKESIHTSEKINKLTDFQFRLWISLITYVDDYGRGDARPAVIKGVCFPLRNSITLKGIDAALHQLAITGCISLYEVDGKSYLCLSNWENHQRIQQKRSRFPSPGDKVFPKDDDCCVTVTHRDSPLESESNTNPNPNTKGERARETRFTPPTIEDVKSYCSSRNNSVDPQKFLDYYTSNGWRVGKNPMKDWKAAVRTWERNEYGSPAKAGTDYQKRQYTDSDFAAMEVDLDNETPF